MKSIRLGICSGNVYIRLNILQKLILLDIKPLINLLRHTTTFFDIKHFFYNEGYRYPLHSYGCYRRQCFGPGQAGHLRKRLWSRPKTYKQPLPGIKRRQTLLWLWQDRYCMSTCPGSNSVSCLLMYIFVKRSSAKVESGQRFKTATQTRATVAPRAELNARMRTASVLTMGLDWVRWIFRLNYVDSLEGFNQFAGYILEFNQI